VLVVTAADGLCFRKLFKDTPYCSFVDLVWFLGKMMDGKTEKSETFVTAQMATALPWKEREKVVGDLTDEIMYLLPRLKTYCKSFERTRKGIRESIDFPTHLLIRNVHFFPRLAVANVSTVRL